MSSKTKKSALRISAVAVLAALSAMLLTGCVPAATGTAAGGAGAEGGATNTFMTILPLILIIAVFYFIMIRPQQKKTKQTNEMRNSIKPGDYVTTIGGFRGRVVRVKDEVITIQSGADKTKLDIMKWGISKIDEAAPEQRSSKPKTIKPVSKRVDDEDEIEETAKKPKKLSRPVKKEDEPEDALAEEAVEAEENGEDEE